MGLARRVRFVHPMRVQLEGAGRTWRLLSHTLSRRGMFLRMPNPLGYPVSPGTRVELSMEAGGQVLPFARAEVAWRRAADSARPDRASGIGVRFTEYLNPRAEALVVHLVGTLEEWGHPRAPKPARWPQVVQGGAVGLLVACAFFVWRVASGWSSSPPMPAQAAALNSVESHAAVAAVAAVDGSTGKGSEGWDELAPLPPVWSGWSPADTVERRSTRVRAATNHRGVARGPRSARRLNEGSALSAVSTTQQRPRLATRADAPAAGTADRPNESPHRSEKMVKGPRRGLSSAKPKNRRAVATLATAEAPHRLAR